VVLQERRGGNLLFEVVSAVIAPGWGMRRRHRVLAAALLAAGVVLPLVLLARIVLSGRSWVALGLDPAVAAAIAWAAGLALIARVVSVFELWHAHRWWRPWSWNGALAVVVILVTWASLGLGAVEATRARRSAERTFSEPLPSPLFDADGPMVTPTPAVAATVTTTTSTTTSTATSTATTVAVTVTTTSPTSGSLDGVSGAPRYELFIDETTTTVPPRKPDRPSSGIDPVALADVSTILLIGGDAGPGRWSLRTDTMMLLSIHRPSGRSALVSIPRNLERLLFPVGTAMESRYPYGFTDLTNAVYPVVKSTSGLRDAYGSVPGVEPGVVALAEGLGYSLDVTIDDYVLIDMRGFVSLVDALGGVTVDLPMAVPMPGNIPNAPTQYPDVIGPGVVFMDGTIALGYARSRSMDSDYQRTERQRRLLAALGRQLSVADLLSSYGAVLDAVGDSLRTSLTPDELANIVAVIGGQTAIVESVGLVPPLVSPRRPDWFKLARVAGEVRLALATGTPSGWSRG
jgi:LCP family protein required for cell wall assembly